LLKLKIAVQCDENIADTVGAAQKFAVFDARPTQTVNRYDFVACQKVCEVCREILIKQQTHRR
jgi:hypothetical protein